LLKQNRVYAHAAAALIIPAAGTAWSVTWSRLLQGSRRRPGSVYPPFLPVQARVPACAGTYRADRASRALGCDAEVFVLVQDTVERVLVVAFDLEDADFPVGDVAIVVEADHPLERLGFRGLDRVADIG